MALYNLTTITRIVIFIEFFRFFENVFKIERVQWLIRDFQNFCYRSVLNVVAIYYTPSPVYLWYYCIPNCIPLFFRKDLIGPLGWLRLDFIGPLPWAICYTILCSSSSWTTVAGRLPCSRTQTPSRPIHLTGADHRVNMALHTMRRWNTSVSTVFVRSNWTKSYKTCSTSSGAKMAANLLKTRWWRQLVWE